MSWTSANHFLSFILLMIFSLSSFAGPSYTTYQAKIIKPDGNPLTASGVGFKFTILDDAGLCILYSETYSGINMSSSGGLVSFSLGSGVKTYPASATTFEQVFSNITPFLSCDNGGGTYSPLANDSRKIVMQFNDSNGWQTLPAMRINAVPYAMFASDAQSLGGVSATAYLQKSEIATCSGGQASFYNGTNFVCAAMSGGGVTSSTINTALGFTPADAASFTTFTSSLSNTNSEIFSVSSTVTSLSNTVAASFAAITSSQWSSGGGSEIYYNTGNVGIGSATPGAKLTVNGQVSLGKNNSIDLGNSSNESSLFGNYNNYDSGGGGSNEAYAFGSHNILDNGGNGSRSMFVFGSRNIATDSTVILGYGVSNTAANSVAIGFNNTTLNVLETGNVGVGTTNPTARVHITEGSTSVAPLKFTSGSLLAAPAAGAVEYDGSSLYFTDETNTRHALSFGNSSGITSSAASIAQVLGYTPAAQTQVTTLSSTIGSVSSSLNSLSNSTAVSFAAIASSQWSTSGSTINFGSGNVGIGTVNPDYKLTVSGTSYFNSSMVVGNNPSTGTIDLGSLLGTANSYSAPLLIQETVTDFTKDFTMTKASVMKLNSSAPSSGYVVNDLNYTQNIAGNGMSYGSIFGGLDAIENNGSGGITQLVGRSSYVFNNGAGTVMYAAGVNSKVYTYSGTTNNSYGGWFGSSHVGGTLINSYGVKIDSALGTATNNYGLYISDAGLMATSYAANIFSAGSSSKNIFEGRLGVGGVYYPNAKLHLGAGNASEAPFKFTSGTLLTSPASGALEYDGFNLYYTDGTNTRRTIAANAGTGTYDAVSTIANSSGNIALYPNSGAGSVTVSATTASTNSSTGALIVKGGMGLTGNLFSSGTITTTAANGITSPKLTLVGGDDFNAYTKPQIAFGWNNTTNFSHYIHSRHNSDPTNGSALDFYTSDGVQNGVYPTNAVLGMTIANGRVGVGVAAPASPLHVYGSGSTGLTLERAGNANVSIDFKSTSGFTGIDGGGSGAYLRAFTSGTERMMITSNGHVGIGTNIPSADIGWASPALEVSGTRGTMILRTGVAGGISTLRFVGPTLGSDFHVNMVDSTGGLIFGPQSGSITALSIAKDGRIGVGTGSVSGGTGNSIIDGDLQVARTTSGTLMQLRGPSTDYAGLKIKTSAGNISGATDYFDFTVRPSVVAGVGTVGDQTMIRFNNTYPRTYADVSLAPNGGNVGIGTSSPASLLEISASGTNTNVLTPSAATLRLTNSDSTSGNTVDIRFTGAGGYPGAKISGIFTNQSTTPEGALSFMTTSNGVAGFAERMRIDPVGNIGIGTSTPTAKLEVSGAIKIPGVGQVGPAGIYGYGMFVTGTNTFVGQMYGAASGVQFTNSTGVNTMNIQDNGDVGIGTIAAISRLTVSANAANANLVTLYNSASSGVSGFNTYSSSGTLVGGIGWGNYNSAGSYNEKLFINSAKSMTFITNNTERMGITSGGLVGIGIAPTNVLSIMHTTPTIGIFDQDFNMADSSSMGKIAFGSGGAEWGSIGLTRRPGFADDVNDMVFKTSFATGAGGPGVNNEVMRMTAQGYLGIGTSSPAATLDVFGTMRVTGQAFTNTGNGAFTILSDIRYKDVSGLFNRGLNEILNIDVIKYNYKKDNPIGADSSKQYVGVSAQNLKQQIPEAVETRKENEKEFLSVNTSPLLFTMINAVKELYAKFVGHDEQLEKQSRRIASLEEQNAVKDKEIKDLKAYLCAKDPSAVICK